MINVTNWLKPIGTFYFYFETINELQHFCLRNVQLLNLKGDCQRCMSNCENENMIIFKRKFRILVVFKTND